MKKRIVSALLSAVLLLGLLPTVAFADAEADLLPEVQSSTLPQQYDGRSEGIITPVKDQGGSNLCWAYSSIAASEASILRSDIDPAVSTNTLDLDPRAAAARVFQRGADSLGNTSGVQSGEDYTQKSGNPYKIASLFSMWHGPYASGGSVDHPAYLLENVVYLPESADRAEIKQAIMQYGAVTFQYNNWQEKDYYNPKNETASGSSPHACTIIGWDDTISADTFQPGGATQPGGWLVKNSYSSHEYFYLSYDNTSSVMYAFDYVPADTYDYNYYYDGNVDDFSLRSDKQAANVYQAKKGGTDGKTEYLKAVNVGVNGTDATLQVQVYTGLRTADDVQGGTLAAEKQLHVDYGGYVTVSLDTPVALEKDSWFSVVVRVASGSATLRQCQPTSEDSTFYSYTASGESWTKQKSFITRIKALTVLDDAPQDSPATTPDDSNFTNLVVFCKFAEEAEFINKSYAGATVREIIDNTYNKSMYSAADYFETVSGGRVKMKTLYLFDDGASLTLSNRRAHYAEKTDENPEGYETANFGELMLDWGNAINAALGRGNRPVDAAGNVYTLADLDKNNDGKIDALTILYKNTEQSNISVSWSSPLWDYQSVSGVVSATENGREYRSNSFLQLTCNYENSSGSVLYRDSDQRPILGTVGKICHETMHIMGLKDLYSSKQDEEIVSWMSLMGRHYSPIGQYISGKELEALGWLGKDQVQTMQNGAYTLKQLSSQSGTVVCKRDLGNGKALYLEYRRFDNLGNKYDKNTRDAFYIQSGNQVKGNSKTVGLVCYLVNSDVRFPSNLNTGAATRQMQVVVPYGKTIANCALGENESLFVTQVDDTWVEVTVTSLTDEELTFTISGLPETTTTPEVTLSAVTIQGDTTATVPLRDSTTRVTLQAMAAYSSGTSEDVTSAATWTLADSYAGVSLENGVLTIQPTAAAGSITARVAFGGKEASHTIVLSKAASVPAVIQVLKNDQPITTDTVQIPGSGTRTVTYTAAVYDQYGAPCTAEVRWELTAADTGATQSGGTLSVSADASAGTIRLTAAAGTSAMADVTITLQKKLRHALSAFAQETCSVTYGDTISGQTVTSTTGTVQYTSSDADHVQVDAATGALTIRKAGTVTITASVAETEDYAASSAFYTLTVNPKTLRITGLSALGRAYEPDNVTVALSGGTLTGKVGADDVSVTIPTSGTMETDTAGAGKTVRVTAPQLTGADRDNYVLASPGTLSVTIEKAVSDVGTVTVSSPATIYPATPLVSITLSKTGTTPGSLTLTAGQNLSIGTAQYDWMFTPRDEQNYEPATGKVVLTVTADSLMGIAVQSGTALQKTAYHWGEAFDLTGVVIEAVYASGTRTALQSQQLEYSTALTVGQTSVTVRYETKSCVLHGITVAKAASRTLPEIPVSRKFSATAAQQIALSRAGMPLDAGVLTYRPGTPSTEGAATVSGFRVEADGTLHFAITGGAAGETVTLPVYVDSENYEESLCNIVVTLTDRTAQASLLLSAANTVTYGQTLTLSASGGSGSGAVWYEVVGGTGAASITANVLTPVRAGAVQVRACKAGDAEYAPAYSAYQTLTIHPARPTGTPCYTPIHSAGMHLSDAALRADTDHFSVPGTVIWVAEDGLTPLPTTTEVLANAAYHWRFVPDDTTNYESLTGTIILWQKAATPEHGSTTRPSASRPSTPVSEEPATMPHFTDVPADAYYQSAVTWAAQNAITAGTSARHFSPDLSCTRAQIVTLLWRAAGAPAPQQVRGWFDDVREDSVYAAAIAWAAEQGLTEGVGAQHFAPDAPCTRAQAVALLYRAAGQPEVQSGTAFHDVPEDAYYAAAVNWATQRAITDGVGNNRFGAESLCTRAQIITFLYRLLAA